MYYYSVGLSVGIFLVRMNTGQRALYERAGTMGNGVASEVRGGVQLRVGPPKVER